MPFVSQAQRGLAHAAADHKGGAGGMTQAAGRQLVADDKGGKLPAHTSKADNLYRKKGVRKGYDKGGEVQWSDEDWKREEAYQAARIRAAKSKKLVDDDEKRRPQTKGTDDTGGAPVFDENWDDSADAAAAEKFRQGKAKGGAIRSTSGPPVGKDDGMIPAQKGEYVVRKSAVDKLGTDTLDEVNKGRLPAGKADRLYRKKGVKRGG